MNDRKETIIREIRYWKAHNLLPVQYCDFLLHLYTEGEEEQEPVKDGMRKKRSLNNLPLYLFMLLLVSQLPITFLVIYFTELSHFLQISIFVFFNIISLSSGYIYYRKKSKFVHFPIIIGALVLFLWSVHLTTIFISAEKWLLITVILSNCSLWTFAGWKMKLTYLTIAGISGAILLVSYNFL
ncbi:hypothetical protein [Bacillus solimangrovi]|uniref:hypothetical protein n=1 Tax=Bacillus solimangrovi TaxID=1305675 RepID=UPI003CCC23CF